MVTNKRVWLGAVIVLAVFALYIGGLWRNYHEKRDRSLELADEVPVADRVLVRVTVVKVDPTARQLTARLQFRPLGNIADHNASPAVNLKLLVNSSPGQHVFEFPAGAAMVRIEATFPLEGDPNRYPFDRYHTSLWLLMDTPSPSSNQQAPEVPRDIPDDAAQREEAEAVVGTELQGNVPVPLSILVSASSPGMKYAGEVVPSPDFGITRVRLNLQRPDNLINTSITVMCLMMGLALSVLAMVVRTITSSKNFEVFPLPFAMALIFGLPALRNIQPYVPPVGVLGDYFSFIWAELLVAACAIMTALTWVIRTTRP